MNVTFLERKILKNLVAGQDPKEGVPPKSRAGVIGSIAKKGFAEWQPRRLGRYSTAKVLSITPKGRRALSRPAPADLEQDYKNRQGLRKFFGLNPVSSKKRYA